MSDIKNVFLGGTTNKTKWRDELIPMLDVSYFNPVVDDWNEEAQTEEIKQRNGAKYCLYTITPKMKGVYSIAEVVDDSNKRPDKTILCILFEDSGKIFDDDQIKSLNMVSKMITDNGGHYFESLNDVANFINKRK